MKTEAIDVHTFRSGDRRIVSWEENIHGNGAGAVDLVFECRWIPHLMLLDVVPNARAINKDFARIASIGDVLDRMLVVVKNEDEAVHLTESILDTFVRKMQAAVPAAIEKYEVIAAKRNAHIAHAKWAHVVPKYHGPLGEIQEVMDP